MYVFTYTYLLYVEVFIYGEYYGESLKAVILDALKISPDFLFVMILFSSGCPNSYFS